MKLPTVAYKRTICPAYEIGSYGGCRKFYIDIKLYQNGRLTLCGQWHSCGQNADELTNDKLVPAAGFERSDILRIQSIWKRWHLNDMRAGTPKQEEFIRLWNVSHKYDYTEACKALKEVGLLYDNGYKYGSAWLQEEVPKEVIQYLFTLPSVDGDSWVDIEPEAIDEQEFLSVLNLD